MGRKLLFILGIVLGHGALAATWVSQEAPKARPALIATCSKTPGAIPDFTPRPMLYAAFLGAPRDEVMRP